MQPCRDKSKKDTKVTILVTGREGSGKSTLINCLLGRPVAVVRGALQNPKTTKAQSYEGMLGTIKLTILEATPGLHDTTYLTKQCSKDSNHLILYCVDMSVTRYNETETFDTMSQLSPDLGIFKRTMFVLTFANKYILQIDDDYPNDPEGKKKNFVDIVELWKTKLQSTLMNKIGLDRDSVKKAKVVPVGSQKTLQLLPDVDLDWLSYLWQEARYVSAFVTQMYNGTSEQLIDSEHDLYPL